MRFMATFLLLSLLSVRDPLWAQEAGSSAAEHLQPLDKIVGAWEYKGQDKEGVEFVGRETVRWAFNRTALKGEGSWKNAKDELSDYEFFVVWNPMSKQVEMRGFTSNGGGFSRTGVIDPKSGVWTSWHAGWMEDGKPLQGIVQIVFSEDAKSFQWNAKEGTLDGAPWPLLDLTFTKIGPTNHPMHLLLGDWEMTDPMGVTTPFSSWLSKDGKSCFSVANGSFFSVSYADAKNQNAAEGYFKSFEDDGYLVSHTKTAAAGGYEVAVTAYKPDGTTEKLRGVFEPIPAGYKYTIDDTQVYQLRRK